MHLGESRVLQIGNEKSLAQYPELGEAERIHGLIWLRATAAQDINSCCELMLLADFLAQQILGGLW